MVGADEEGMRLDAAVAALEGVASRAEGQRLIDAGRVLVDGRVVPKRHLLELGEVVTVRPEAPPGPLEAEEVPLVVLYEDEHLLVVDKPAGVVTHPSGAHERGTLVHGLLARGIRGGDDPSRPGIVHRLDRDTSGLLVVARTERAHVRLGRMMRRREIDRRYIGLVHGQLPPALTVDRPVGRDRQNRTRMSVVTDHGREAVTHARRLEALARFSLVEVRLETGRTHQIRVHLAAVGHPVAGDPLYGKRPDGLGLRRQFLHAAHLSFPHPEGYGVVAVESPLPADLAVALERARAQRA